MLFLRIIKPGGKMRRGIGRAKFFTRRLASPKKGG
jgi:hypothetical protein